MSTIATDILRNYEAEIANAGTGPATAGANTGATTGANGAPSRPAAHMVMRRLCEQAQGTRIGYREWVFPDGSQLQT